MLFLIVFFVSIGLYCPGLNNTRPGREKPEKRVLFVCIFENLLPLIRRFAREYNHENTYNNK